MPLNRTIKWFLVENRPSKYYLILGIDCAAKIIILMFGIDPYKLFLKASDFLAYLQFDISWILSANLLTNILPGSKFASDASAHTHFIYLFNCQSHEYSNTVTEVIGHKPASRIQCLTGRRVSLIFVPLRNLISRISVRTFWNESVFASDFSFTVKILYKVQWNYERSSYPSIMVWGI